MVPISGNGPIADLELRTSNGESRRRRLPRTRFLWRPYPSAPGRIPAVASALLAMNAYGVASCPQGLLSFYADDVRAELGLTTADKLLVGISFGYADDAAPVNHISTPRAALI